MKTKANTHPLPDKLSDLILVALEDLEKAEKSPHYKIDMGTWHRPNGQCAVCFAGSVIAHSLRGRRTHELMPENFNHYTQRRLIALDRVRSGIICCALNELDARPDDLPCAMESCFDTTDYHDDPEAFKTEMVLTAFALKEFGL